MGSFTLAEVLIVLGIIGLVADMTLPTLILSTQEKVAVSKVKQTYSMLSQAFQMAYTDKGLPDTWGLSDMYNPDSHRIVAQNVIPYLKLLRDCTGSDVANAACKFNLDKTVLSAFILSNGTAVSVRNVTSLCDMNLGNSEALKNICGEILIDINNTKKPGQNGKNRFSILYTKYGLVPYGVPNSILTFEKRVQQNRNCAISKLYKRDDVYLCSMGNL